MNKKEYEELQNKILAPFAMKSSESKGRVHKEPECEFRTCFQRDRDRIIHSTAFRRLEYKTQVFINHEGDYYRTRLTHTLEVAQISRGISRALGLNEDLAESIALSHDLGHTPFGHRGEFVLNKLMNDFGGFEHNRQSLRVVTLLEERYPDFNGLNLSIEVLEGLAKHETEYDLPVNVDLKTDRSALLEAQVVNLSDEIAYMNHDLDDGIHSGMLNLSDLMQVNLWKEILLSVEKEFPNAPIKIKRYQTVRRLIHFLVSDVQSETLKNIQKFKIASVEDVRNCEKPVVTFSTETAKKVKEAINFLFDNLYRHYHVERMASKCSKIITELFESYTENPGLLPPRLFEQIKADEKNIHRYVCDYIAGMTDRFALDEHRKLFDPNELV